MNKRVRAGVLDAELALRADERAGKKADDEVNGSEDRIRQQRECSSEDKPTR